MVKITEIPFKCRGYYMYFYTWTMLGILRFNVSHITFAEIPFIMSILIRAFQFVYYLHAIHSVKLAKLVRHHNRTT